MKRKQKKAFTMMELVIVIAIIALLGAIATPKFMDFLDNAKVTAADAQIKAFIQAANMYKIQHKKFPQSIEDLNRVNPDGTSYMDNATDIDPWGNPYVVSTNNGRFDVMSYGADGTSGGEGINADISGSKRK